MNISEMLAPYEDILSSFFYTAVKCSKWFIGYKMISSMFKEYNKGDFHGIVNAALLGSGTYAALFLTMKFLDSIAISFGGKG